MPVDPQLLERLACPRHGTPLTESGSLLICGAGHDYPVVEDIPVMLDEGPQTLWVAESSRAAARSAWQGEKYFIDTIGISDEERLQLVTVLEKSAQPQAGSPDFVGSYIDPVVSFLVGATNGIAYKHLIGNLSEYPIPDLRLPRSNGEWLIDIGCNWGRWSMAAARLGYQPIGIDPQLGAVLAAKRVSKQLGLKTHFIVGDARFLPIRDASIDVAFSYSVLQHFSKDDAAAAIAQIGRVLHKGGRALVQMPTILGLRCIYHQAHRGFREPQGFDVRYWSLSELRRVFGERVGETRFSIDCFFGIGLQASDLALMPASLRATVRASEMLRKTLPWLTPVADSVYVESLRS